MHVDFSKSPFLVIWETTHACDLACVHCRANAEPNPDPDELNHEQAKKLIRDVKEMGTPIFVFSGGDPLKRPDLETLVRYAKSLELRTGVIPAVTPALTLERIRGLKGAGLDQMAFSLDAANAKDHDAFRRTEGVFDRTLEAIRLAKNEGLKLQINSLVNVHNTDVLDELITLIETFGIVFWEVFFLVPTGRGADLDLLSGEKYEKAFEKIYELSKHSSFLIKVTEAPHYRRFYIEQKMKEAGEDPAQVNQEHVRELPAYLRQKHGPSGSIGRAPQGVNSAKGFTFVSCRGEVMPSGFLPLSGGNVKHQSLQEIYRDSELFKNLRDTSKLTGRCGHCVYKNLCGGSRARAFAMTGDYYAEDPCCVYQPQNVAVTERSL